MIIRSQDKTSITTDLNLKIYEDDWTNNFEITNEAGMELGAYSTEEKAIKVLDMIQDKYCMMNASNCMMTGTMRSLLEVTKEIQDKTIKAHRDLYVFEMPADNEVEV